MLGRSRVQSSDKVCLPTITTLGSRWGRGVICCWSWWGSTGLPRSLGCRQERGVAFSDIRPSGEVQENGEWSSGYPTW